MKKLWDKLKNAWMLLWGATQGSRTLIVAFAFFITFFLGASGSLDYLWEDSPEDDVMLTLEMEEAIEADANDLAQMEEVTEELGDQEEEEVKSFLSEAASKAKLMASGIVDATGKVVNSFGEAIGGFFSFKLPNGLDIQIPEGGFEEKFLKFLEGENDSEDAQKYFVFDRIYFKTGSSTINQSSDDQINSIVSILKAYDDKSVLLRGHTDSTGSLVNNETLSLKRATALKTILVEKGIDASRVSLKGLGPKEPIGDNATSQGRLRNRRIDISLIGQ